MKVERIFLAHGRVRSIWRFFLSVPMVYLAMLAARTAATFVAGPTEMGGWGRMVWSTLLLMPALLAAFKLLTAALDQKPLSSVGLAFCGRWHAELGMGLGVGAMMILTVGVSERLLGVAQFAVNSASPEEFLGWGLALLVFLLVAATNEELIFRGYPFQRLVDSIGAPGAVAVLSALFGLGHLLNPHHTWISTINTVLVGVPLAVSYLRTRALWMPVGIHFAWNFLQGYGLGLPVSGIVTPFSILRAQVSGNVLLTGGGYGPEGNLLTTLIIVGATGYLLRSKSIYISEEMRTLVFGPPLRQASSPGSVVRLGISSEQAKDDRPDPR